LVTQVGQEISIKGIREGLLITLGNGPDQDILQQLTLELAEKRDFLFGSKIVMQLGERSWSYTQLSQIQKLFEKHGLTLWTVLADQESTRAAARKLELATRLPGSHTDLEGNLLPAAESDDPTPGTPSHQEKPAADPDGLLLKETLRSGRSVYHEGHVVVIGDVNPGAEIIAGGDVIVWGRLRGLVHAGALGDAQAVICALDLNPTQLRIANQIAVPPDEHGRQPVPEQAFIRSGQIVAESWPLRP